MDFYSRLGCSFFSLSLSLALAFIRARKCELNFRKVAFGNYAEMSERYGVVFLLK